MASDLFIFCFLGVIPHNAKNDRKKEARKNVYKNNKNEILLFIGCISNSSMENRFV
jgi:hypothetical protein